MQKLICCTCRHNLDFENFVNKLNVFLSKGGKVISYHPNVSYYPGVQVVIETNDPRLFRIFSENASTCEHDNGQADVEPSY